MVQWSKHLPEAASMTAILLCHGLLWRWAEGRSPWLRRAVIASVAFALSGMIFEMHWAWSLVPSSEFFLWARGLAIGWGICACGTTIAIAIARQGRRIEPTDPGRRALLKTAQAAVVAAPAAITGFGVFIERRAIEGKEVSLPIRGLPRDLDGLRIAQLSDIHMSAFLSPKDLAHAVGIANEFRPHLSVVTGDLITRDGDPLDLCMREVSRLRAEAGVFGCMGNHEVYAECEDYVAREMGRLGVPFLRKDRRVLRFGDARLNLAGVDYEKMRGPYLTDTGHLVDSESFNLLLSHNPDAFRAAPAQGWNLMLAGHTHGGQVTVEYLHQHLNIARFFTPFVYGHYEEGNSHLYVTRGIGTVGVPARIGARPEVALIKLCAT